MTDWLDISYHDAFQNSGADFEALFTIITPILAGAPQIFHLRIDPDAINKVLDAPIVELVTYYHVGEGFDEAVAQTLAIGTKSEGCLGFVRAPVVEEIGIAQGGVEGKAHYAAISWASLEARTEAMEREEVKASGLLLEGKIGGSEVHHVKFQLVS